MTPTPQGHEYQSVGAGESARSKTNWRSRRGQKANWRGPRRALTLDEQLEVGRLMREARAERRSIRTAVTLAGRYGVSSRTIHRYCRTLPVPVGLENLRVRLSEWSAERDLRLTTDDMVTLLMVIDRYRDAIAAERERQAVA